MKVIISGGQNYYLTREDWNKLDRLGITEVVNGGAAGADKDGEAYAKKRGIPVRRFPADWKTYGRGAGPVRNREMAKYADGVALFAGGRGTASMKREAERAGITGR